VGIKSYALELEPEPLFVSVLETGLDLTTSADDSLPRKSVMAIPQQARNSAVMKRVTGRRSYLAIGGNFAFGNGENGSSDGFLASGSGTRRVLDQTTRQFRVDRKAAGHNPK
jgi:hypothetical protein